jgi:hypothetical protein
MKKLFSFKQRSLPIMVLISIVLLSACASTKVSDRDSLYSGKLPRPGQIIVFDFVTTPQEMQPDSALANQNVAPATPPTADELELNRQLGVQIAEQLAQEIRAMGLSGVRATQGITPKVNDLMIRGYLLSVDPGSEVKRVALGFGSGASELKTLVEGYQMTVNGPRKLGSGSVDAGGGKGPGGALGLATLLITHNPVGLVVSSGIKAYGEVSGSAKVEGRAKATAKEIADQLKIRFEEQGWIQK